jgi:ribosomal-protein-alanine N-acetyltransferase
MTLLQRRTKRGLDAGGLSIAPFRRRHLRQVLAIENQDYPRPWTPGVFASELAQVREGSRCYVVALLEGRVVGYGGLMFTDDGAHVTNIAVDPAEQRRGIGRRLLVHLMRTARQLGCDAMTLEVRVTNTGAQALYRQFGFAPAGIRKRYYENTDDALVMWCHDLGGDDVARRLAEAESREAT